jgi:hypothetical protein
VAGRYRRRPVCDRVKRKTGADVDEIVRDVLGADGVLEAAFEGPAKGRITVRLQQTVQPLDIMNPDLWSTMGELGELGQGGGTGSSRCCRCKYRRARLPETTKPSRRLSAPSSRNRITPRR